MFGRLQHKDNLSLRREKIEAGVKENLSSLSLSGRKLSSKERKTIESSVQKLSSALKDGRLINAQEQLEFIDENLRAGKGLCLEKILKATIERFSDYPSGTTFDLIVAKNFINFARKELDIKVDDLKLSEVIESIKKGMANLLNNSDLASVEKLVNFAKNELFLSSEELYSDKIEKNIDKIGEKIETGIANYLSNLGKKTFFVIDGKEYIKSVIEKFNVGNDDIKNICLFSEKIHRAASEKIANYLNNNNFVSADEVIKFITEELKVDIKNLYSKEIFDALKNLRYRYSGNSLAAQIKRKFYSS